MVYQLYMMKFHSAHFGTRIIEQTMPTIPVERLFSALFLEAKKLGKADEFLERAFESDYVLTDTMLYRYGLFLPKAIGYPRFAADEKPTKDSRTIAKTVKEMEYLNEMDFTAFIQGKLKTLDDLEDLVDEQKDLYRTVTSTRVGEDPYRIGITYYPEETYLTFIGTKDPLTEELMASLQYSGLGGKRTTGLGRFDFKIQELQEETARRLTTESDEPVMLLTNALAQKSELAESLEGAQYLLTKSSGFVYSEAVKDNLRKQDLYKFKAGSTFQRTFQGDIYDVAPSDFPHPVWNYAKPLFLTLGSD